MSLALFLCLCLFLLSIFCFLLPLLRFAFSYLFIGFQRAARTFVAFPFFLHIFSSFLLFHFWTNICNKKKEEKKHRKENIWAQKAEEESVEKQYLYVSIFFLSHLSRMRILFCICVDVCDGSLMSIYLDDSWLPLFRSQSILFFVVRTTTDTRAAHIEQIQ